MDQAPLTSTSAGPTATVAERLLTGVLIMLALVFAGAYLYVAASTLWYPYQLEWMEGGTMDVVARAAASEPIYTAPSVDYVPYIYTPLYYHLTAWLARWTALDFPVARLVSFAATLGAAGVLVALVRHETRRWTLGLIAAGLFLAAYNVTGRWYHLARVDSLQLCLVALGFACLRMWPRFVGASVAGAVWAAAMLTKQTALVMVLPLAAYGLFAHWRRTLVWLATFGLLTAAVMVYLNRVSGGWFWTFAFEVPRGHALVAEMFAGFWGSDLLAHAPVLLALAVVGAVCDHGSAARGSRWQLVALAAGLMLSSWISRMHEEGYVNVLIPAYYGMCLLAIVGYAALCERACSAEAEGRQAGVRHARATGPRRAALLAALALIAQFAMLAYNPRAAIPTAADRRAGDALLSRLSRIDGDVLMRNHRFVQKRCGKSSCGLGMALNDVVRSADRRMATRLADSICSAVARGRFVAVVDPPEWLKSYVEQPGEPLFDDPEVYYPVTGGRNRPERLYWVRRQFLERRGRVPDGG